MLFEIRSILFRRLRTRSLAAFVFLFSSAAHAKPIGQSLPTGGNLSGPFYRTRAVAPALHGEVRTHSGAPIPGSRVIIPGVGEALSDVSGSFAIEGLRAGVSYTALVQRTGFLFVPSSVTVKVEEALLFTGVEVGTVPSGCTEYSNAPSLVEASHLANRLYSETLALAPKLPPKQRLRLLSGETILASELSIRVEEQYASYQFYSRFVPEIDFRCSDDLTCGEIDLREAKLFMFVEIDNLSHERLLANKVLRKRGRISSIVYGRAKRTTVSLRKKLRGRLAQVQNRVGSCF